MRPLDLGDLLADEVDDLGRDLVSTLRQTLSPLARLVASRTA